MKNQLCTILLLGAAIYFPQFALAQSQKFEHEKPIIADAVPNYPEEMFERGKLSKFVALSVPDDDRWNPSNDTLIASGAVYSIAQFDNDFRSCYFGGHFDNINGIPFKHIAQFKDFGTGTFTDVGGGVEGGDVYVILPLHYSHELYVGGNFTKAGNIPAHGIAHWTGSQWESLGIGTDSTVLALDIISDKLYVGGNFRNAGGQPVNYIAMWDTTNKVWLPVIDGINVGVNGGVAALSHTSNGDLYVGGGFTKAGTVSANKIAILQSGKWSALGNGIEGPNAYVSCLNSETGIMYVGGDFQLAGGILQRNIASLSGMSWQVMYYQFDKPVYTFGSLGHAAFYAGGAFTKYGDSIVNGIAEIFGLDYSVILGSGLNGPCYGLAGNFIAISLPPDHYNNHLFVGGNFTQAGQKPSVNFAVWAAAYSGSVKQHSSLASQVSLKISPNPVQNSAKLSFVLPQRMNIDVAVFDALGRQMLTIGSGWREAGAQEIPIDMKNLPNGYYSCKLQSDGQSVYTSFVVIR